MARNFCPNCGSPVGDRATTECDDCGQDFDDFDKEHDEDFDESLSEPEDDDGFDAGEARGDGDSLFSTPTVGNQESPAVEQNVPQEKKWWEPVVTAIRWGGFIPAGILGGILAGIIAALFIGAGSWLSGFPFFSPWNRLVAAGVGGYATVIIGAQTAPIPNKAVPAIVMGVLIFMIYGIAILFNIGEREWFQIIQCVVGVIAAAASMYQQIEDTRPNVS